MNIVASAHTESEFWVSRSRYQYQYSISNINHTGRRYRLDTVLSSPASLEVAEPGFQRRGIHVN